MGSGEGDSCFGLLERTIVRRYGCFELGADHFGLRSIVGRRSGENLRVQILQTGKFKRLEHLVDFSEEECAHTFKVFLSFVKTSLPSLANAWGVLAAKFTHFYKHHSTKETRLSENLRKPHSTIASLKTAATKTKRRGAPELQIRI